MQHGRSSSGFGLAGSDLRPRSSPRLGIYSLPHAPTPAATMSGEEAYTLPGYASSQCGVRSLRSRARLPATPDYPGLEREPLNGHFQIEGREFEALLVAPELQDSGFVDTAAAEDVQDVGADIGLGPGASLAAVEAVIADQGGLLLGRHKVDAVAGELDVDGGVLAGRSVAPVGQPFKGACSRGTSRLC